MILCWNWRLDHDFSLRHSVSVWCIFEFPDQGREGWSIGYVGGGVETPPQHPIRRLNATSDTRSKWSGTQSGSCIPRYLKVISYGT
jgi:hypothetical protein